MESANTRTNLRSFPRFLEAHRQHGDWPEVGNLNYHEESASVEIALSVPSDLACFAGHFPSQPVLPGVVQIHWAGEFAKYLFNLQEFKSLQGSKFNSMVLPSTKLTLQLQYNSDKQSVKYLYFDDATKYSLGTIVFADAIDKQSL